MIAIKQDLYDRLLLMKQGTQSFSDIIEILLNTHQKNPLAHFSPENTQDFLLFDEFEEILQNYRNENRRRYENLENGESWS